MHLRKYKLSVFALAIVIVVALTGCTGTKTGESSYKAGTYTTEAEGYGGVIKVETTFTDKKIEKIEILENSETVGIGSTAIEKLPSEIVELQSLDVDAVSGATITSTAIIEAVSEAVEEAGGDVDSLKGSSQ